MCSASILLRKVQNALVSVSNPRFATYTHIAICQNWWRATQLQTLKQEDPCRRLQKMIWKKFY